MRTKNFLTWITIFLLSFSLGTVVRVTKQLLIDPDGISDSQMILVVTVVPVFVIIAVVGSLVGRGFRWGYLLSSPRRIFVAVLLAGVAYCAFDLIFDFDWLEVALILAITGLFALIAAVAAKVFFSNQVPDGPADL